MFLVQTLLGSACPLHVDFGLVNLRLIGRIDLILLGLTLGFILRRRVFELLDDAVAFLETTQVMGALAPFGQIQSVAEHCTSLNGFANRIPQQVGVGGEIHVGFDDKGISAGFQRFSCALEGKQQVPGVNHFLVDAVQ